MKRFALVLAALGLGACNPPADHAIPVTGTTTTTEPVIRVAAIDKPVLVDGDRFHAPTTTVVPAATVPAPTVPPPSEPAPAPAPVEVRDVSSTGSVWDRLAQCESGGDWHINTGNGYSGGLQWHPDTWRRAGGTQYAPYAWQATREQEIAVAEAWLARTSWDQWPHCSRVIGVR